MIDWSPRPFRITIYQSETDTVGKRVERLVTRDGLALQRDRVDMETPSACNASFTLASRTRINDGLDLDPDTSTYVRPGAPVLFEYQNYAGTWREVPWGARQVIAFVSLTRPDSVDPGQKPTRWACTIETQQTLKQQQWIEGAFDAEYGKNAPGNFALPEQIGAYRDYTVLGDSICDAKDLNFAPQPGDPVPIMVYNGYVGYPPQTADSALAFLNKIYYCNPNRSGWAFSLWQDNLNRVRITESNLTTARVPADLLYDTRWENYGNGLISFKPINQRRQQMPGKLRVFGIAQFDEFKPNPVRTRTPAPTGAGQIQIQDVETYDYNDWSGTRRTFITRTTQPRSQFKAGESGTTTIREDVIKEYDSLNGRRLTVVTKNRFGPSHLADNKGKFNEIQLTQEATIYRYKSDGTLDSTQTTLDAVPKLIQADAPANQALTLKGGSNVMDTFGGIGTEYSRARARAYNLERQSDLIAYQTSSNANTPDSRPAPTETQEIPWETKQIPVFHDKELLYNGVALSNRVKTENVGAVVFDGSRMAALADNLAYRLSGGYTQYEIKFPLTDAIAAAWVRPGMGMVIYDQESNTKKVFGLLSGDNIVFSHDRVECLCTAEYLGTIENGNQITAAEVPRLTLDGQVRETLDGQTRVV